MSRWPLSRGLSAVVAAAAGGQRTPLFASNWSNSTGSGATALRDGTKWDDEDGGDNTSPVFMQVVPSAGRGPTTNDLQVDHTDSLKYHWVQEYALRSPLSIGEFLAFRIGLYHAITNAAGTQGWAGSHFLEAAAVAGGGSDSADKWEFLMGNEGDGTFPFAVGLNGVGFPYNYICLGGPGDGGGPARIAKDALWWMEPKYTKTGTNLYTMDMRVRNSAGTIIYSTGDALNNIYGWGGLQFGSAGRNTNLAIADAAMVKIRKGKNGGFGTGAAAGVDLIHWLGFAVCDDDWVGPWGSLTTDV